MTSPNWDSNPPQLQNAQIFRNQGLSSSGRNVPVLPPRPMSSSGSYNSYSAPYSFNSYNSPYSSLGGYGGYGSSFGAPYRSSLYGNGYGYGSGYGYGMDDHERRFIQYAEENSRQTFASVESVVRAFNSLAMMLDNTFFAMTSSFRAILGVAENFGRLRTMFGHIWYSVNIFRFVTWLYRRMRQILGLKVTPSASSIAWKEANGASGATPGGSSWPTLAFLGVIVSAPYIISKFLPKYEDKLDPANWKSPGINAKACFDFVATSPNELTIHTNDNIILAPTSIQEEMNLKNTGWAYAVHNGKSGVVPLNYIVICKNPAISEKILVSRLSNKDSNGPVKTHAKKVSFGDIEIFENDENLIRKEKIPPEQSEQKQ